MNAPTHADTAPRYTSYPTAPHFHAGIDSATVEGWISAIPEGERLSLYIHVPFCDRLCWFCACHTKQTRHYKPVATFLEALHHEIRTVAAKVGDRAKVAALSAPIYLDQMGIFSKDGYDKVSDLEGRKVGTVQGYLWVDELKTLLGSNLSLYNNYVAMYQDLEAGRIEIGVDGYGVGSTAQRDGALKGIQIKVAQPDERVGASVAPPQIGLPITLDNTALLAAQTR